MGRLHSELRAGRHPTGIDRDLNVAVHSQRHPAKHDPPTLKAPNLGALDS